MGDEDNGIAALTDTVHVLIQLLTSFLGKSCGGFVDDYDLGIKIGCLYNLNQLSVLEIVIINDIRGLNSVETVFMKKFCGLFVHGICILDSEVYETVLMAQENISATVRPDRVPSSCTMMDTPSSLASTWFFG